jgi:rod shape-determining protein MreC
VLILRWLADQALRGRELISLALTLGLGLWISASPAQVQKKWRTAWTGTVLYPVQSVIGRMQVRWNLERELDDQRRTNARLVADNAGLSEAARIHEDLREFEPVRNRLEYSVVGARVVTRDPLRLGGVWILDAGTESGIGEGMAVISSEGLVGRILSSSPGHSQMQTIADPDCRVSILSARSRSPGILHSADGAGVFVEFSVTSDIRAGDSLVTWGAGGIFPRGLPVGQVAEVRKMPANVLRNARVVPFQDPWTVRDVFVILRPPQLRVLADSSIYFQSARGRS